MPPTAKQLHSTQELFLKTPEFVGTEPSHEGFLQMSNAHADSLINEIKEWKWHYEMFGWRGVRSPIR